MKGKVTGLEIQQNNNGQYHRKRSFISYFLKYFKLINIRGFVISYIVRGIMNIR